MGNKTLCILLGLLSITFISAVGAEIYTGRLRQKADNEYSDRCAEVRSLRRKVFAARMIEDQQAFSAYLRNSGWEIGWVLKQHYEL